MAEDEVNYASIVIKTKKQPQSEAKNEKETVYDEVKVNKQPAHISAGPLSYKEAERYHWYQKMACCFGILCVILVLAIIGVCVHYVLPYKNDEQELKLPKANQTLLLEEIFNLTDLNNKLSSDFNVQIYNLTQEKENLTQQIENLIQENENLTQAKQNLTLQNKNLTTELYEEKNKTQKLQTEKKHLTEQRENLTQENQNLIQAKQNLTLQNQNLTAELYEEKNKTQKLQTEKKNLTEQMKTWNEQNVSRAQWSVDEYCPKENNKGNCSSCQKGWTHSQSSCYAVNNAEPEDQKTWEEAREDCRGKISDLTVVGDEKEKKFVKDNSWVNDKIKGYWIGLRVVGGKWRWIDGSDLTNQTWIQQQPVDGQCVTSLQGREWRSVSCDEKNAWICEKKALSV